MPEQLCFQSNFLVICSMNVLNIPWKSLLNYNRKNDREEKNRLRWPFWFAFILVELIWKGNERKGIHSLSLSHYMPRTHITHIHLCSNKMAHTLFQSFNFCDISFSFSFSFVSFIRRFSMILSLPDSLFPLSVLLKWMNCRFEKYCCCHFALSLSHSLPTNTYTPKVKAHFKPNSTQSNPMDGEKSHCFLALGCDFGKTRGEDQNKPKQRMAFISVFRVILCFHFILPLCRIAMPWFLCTATHNAQCVCGWVTAHPTFYTSTMIFIICIWN